MRAGLGRYWPPVAATVFFLALVICIRPWSELPVNDDWQYAHVAKRFAETGTFRLDVPVAPAVVGQSVIAFPLIKLFGFSHLILRLLTLVLSAGLLFELDSLMKRGAADAKLRLVSLSLVVANPIFLHLAASFMTEIYGFFVALLGACVWYRGKERESKTATIGAALIVGSSFWIRQFSALIFPAIILAEWLADGASWAASRALLRRRAPETIAWCCAIAAYFIWARLTGNAPAAAEERALNILHPDAVAFAFEAGIFLFYITIFFFPFFIAVDLVGRTIGSSVLVVAFLGLTAVLAGAFGHKVDAPNGFLNATFPFLSNVLSKYSVGPPTISDVYFGNVPLTPNSFQNPWLIVELLGIVGAASWPRITGFVSVQRNEVALMGASVAVISAIAVWLTYRSEVVDRYYFPGILGFAIALAVCFPLTMWTRLRNAAVVAVTLMSFFSTSGLHDYFRWQEARLELLRDAQRAGLKLSDVYAGYEFDGWNTVEGIAVTPGCNLRSSWFCRGRTYRIGVQAIRGETALFSRPVNSWLIHFPDLKLFDRSKS